MTSDDGVDRSLDQLTSCFKTLLGDQRPLTVFVTMHEGGFRDAYATTPVRLVFVNDSREYGREAIELPADRTVIRSQEELDQMILANPSEPLLRDYDDEEDAP